MLVDHNGDERLVRIIVDGLRRRMRAFKNSNGTAAYVCLCDTAVSFDGTRGLLRVSHIDVSVAPVCRCKTLEPQLWLARKDAAHPTQLQLARAYLSQIFRRVEGQ